MGNKLYVGNLPYSVRDSDLEQAFGRLGGGRGLGGGLADTGAGGAGASGGALDPGLSRRGGGAGRGAGPGGGGLDGRRDGLGVLLDGLGDLGGDDLGLFGGGLDGVQGALAGLAFFRPKPQFTQRDGGHGHVVQGVLLKACAHRQRLAFGDVDADVGVEQVADGGTIGHH